MKIRLGIAMPWRLVLWMVAVALLLAMMLAIGHDVDFRRQRNEVMAADWAARQLGQHFVVGYKRGKSINRLWLVPEQCPTLSNAPLINNNIDG